ncbi:hypothetical protein CROQUDRAFT_677505 [Cronartium quercuum f. sp. fusiforme G11]|uniref:Uncharacterized protein n=1 Tax=Cronartium quercuum f. sp. fusiforme G11 TaxID=708437 RepID=A0A9P6NG91_9BASI|nr:hypothetical protein CROQUDRAFT_677505 [Cronartium quercuum f. sp. fusiforme G11]
MISLRLISVAVALSALTSTTNGQDLTKLIGSLSSSCQGAAAGLMTSDFATCANIMDFIPVIGATGSIVTPFSNWVTTTCPLAPCSDATASAALTSINQGCASDIAKGVPTAVSLSSIVANYGALRTMVCAQYVSNSTFCATTLFSAIEKATTKPVTVTNLETFITEGFSSLVPLLAAVPNSQYCNACGKELYIDASKIKTVAKTSSAASASSNDALTSSICGASFVDGQHPTSVRQATASNTTTSSTLGGTSAVADASKSSGSQFKPSLMFFFSLPLLALFNFSA